jgi:hypothetical protein
VGEPDGRGPGARTTPRSLTSNDGPVWSGMPAPTLPGSTILDAAEVLRAVRFPLDGRLTTEPKARPTRFTERPATTVLPLAQQRPCGNAASRMRWRGGGSWRCRPPSLPRLRAPLDVFTGFPGSRWRGSTWRWLWWCKCGLCWRSSGVQALGEWWCLLGIHQRCRIGVWVRDRVAQPTDRVAEDTRSATAGSATGNSLVMAVCRASIAAVIARPLAWSQWKMRSAAGPSSWRI